MSKTFVLDDCKHVLYRMFDPCAKLNIHETPLRGMIPPGIGVNCATARFGFENPVISFGRVIIEATINSDNGKYSLDLSNINSVMPIVGEVSVTAKCNVWSSIEYGFVCVDDSTVKNINIANSECLTISKKMVGSDVLHYHCPAGHMFEYRKLDTPQYELVTAFNIKNYTMRYERELNKKDLFVQYPSTNHMNITSIQFNLAAGYVEKHGIQMFCNGQKFTMNPCFEKTLKVQKVNLDQVDGAKCCLEYGLFESYESKFIPGSIATCLMDSLAFAYADIGKDLTQIPGDVIITFYHSSVYLAKYLTIVKYSANNPSIVEGLKL